MVCCSGSARTGPADTDLYGTRHLVTTGGSQHILFMYVVSHRQNPWWLSCSAVPAAAACLLKGPAFFFGHSCFGMVCSGLVRSRPAGFDGTRHLVTTRGSQHTVSFKIHHQNPWWLSGSAVPAVAACLLRWPAYFVVHSSFGTCGHGSALPLHGWDSLSSTIVCSGVVRSGLADFDVTHHLA